MKRNVDLTQDIIFHERRSIIRSFVTTKRLEISKGERCEECATPICKPWDYRDFCSKCKNFFARMGWNKIPCWKQLDYSTYEERREKQIKLTCRMQLGDPNPYIDKQSTYFQLRGDRR